MATLEDVQVRDYMATNLVTFRPEMEISKAIALLIRHQYSGAPVVDEMGRLVGMLSEKDCLEVAVMASGAKFAPSLVGDYMTTKVISVSPKQSLMDAARQFIDLLFKRLPVVEGGRLVGQISRSDVLRAIHELS